MSPLSLGLTSAAPNVIERLHIIYAIERSHFSVVIERQHRLADRLKDRAAQSVKLFALPESVVAAIGGSDTGIADDQSF